MQNNGWYLDMNFQTPDFLSLDELRVSSDKYGDIGKVPFHYGCATGANIVYYVIPLIPTAITPKWNISNSAGIGCRWVLMVFNAKHSYSRKSTYSELRK
ncbi:hypothetical protein BGX26_004518 [Mortierella sp. AD094]|nr:hypothetical protein BGX26_004518 [Mortierella sp. AD094]